MDTLIGFFVFIFGAIIGSFLNVCIYRLPKDESIVFPMSHCPKCNRNIFWYDNIPIFSYVVLRGQCRFCGSKISPRYFIVEFLTGALLLALFFAFGITPKFFAYSVFVCGLVVATFIDFEIQEIPDQISIGGIVVGLVSAVIFPSIFDTSSRLSSIPDSFFGAVTGGAIIYIMKTVGTIAFRDKVKKLGIDSAMGDGDIKLMAMIGAFLGWKFVLITFFVAPLFGVVAGVILKLKDGREIIPYGPYLSLGALVAIFFGNKILSMFLF